MKTPSQEKLEQLLRENPNKGNRMLTRQEIELLRQDRIESGEACRKVMLEAMARRKTA